MNYLMLDPGLALPAPGPASGMAEFWLRFVEWERDSRVALGRETYDAVSAYYSTVICVNPASQLPRGMGKSVHRAMVNMLGRMPLVASETFIEKTMDIRYLGTDDNYVLLAIDLGSDHHAEQLRLATSPDWWPDGASGVGVVPAPPSQVTFEHIPNSPSYEELWADRAKSLSAVEILIVGGQPEDRVINRIVTLAKISASKVKWVASEKSKTPRNLDAQVNSTTNPDTVVFCITGKIAHSTYFKLKENCASSSITFVHVDSSGSILDALGELVDSRSGSTADPALE